MTKLKISPDLSLPLDFVTSTQAILAQKGKGKSYTASVQAEELLKARQQVVVIDPTGAWWGLRSSADGKEKGYPIAILGGEHADVPLEATAGEVIADAIASEHFSAVIDLTLFRKNEALRFMGTFLETLYRKNRDALHLFIDEADVVAPQKTFSPEQARCLGASEDIVRRGRIRGIGCTLISQRAQVINKDVLSQVDMLTTLGMNHPKDLGAIDDWVAVHGDPKQAKRMIDSLPSLPKGEAWVWAPAVDLFKRVRIRERETFDSGKTPKAGERVAAPKVLATVDIERLGTAIAGTVERAKQADPKALKARVAELEKQLAAKPGPKVETKEVEIEVLGEKPLKRLEAAVSKAEPLVERLVESINHLSTSFSDIKVTIERIDQRPPQRPQTLVHTTTTKRTTTVGTAAAARVVRTSTPAATRSVSAPASDLPIGEAATLRALIQYPAGLRRQQLTVMTGYKRSTRDAYIARLRERGLVGAGSLPDLILATDAGCQAMPDAEPLPVGAALQEWWLARLPAGEAAVLGQLLDAGGASITRDAITESTGYKRSTRDAYLSRLAAKELVDEAGRGEVKASATLFGGD